MSTGCEPTTERGVGVLLEGGVVLTSAHVVAGAESIEVVLNGDTHSAQVLAFDPFQDLATLQINTGVTGLTLGEVDPGSAAWILTFDHIAGDSAPEMVEVTQHLSATITDIYQQENVTRKVLEIDGVVRVGDSGSALVGLDGNVGGIVFATSHPANTTGFALDIEPLQDIVAASHQPLTSWGACD
jgi:S1-C subfamily serine protease